METIEQTKPSTSKYGTISKETIEFVVPETRYFKTREDFDQAVGKDFIKYANQLTSHGEIFVVGLAHGQSPSGAYQYILNHFYEINCQELLRFSFVNSPLKRQRDLVGVMDSGAFLRELIKKGHITKEQILGSNLNRESIESFSIEFNERFKKYLEKHRKTGLDYVFLSTNPQGHVAGIARKSTAFNSKEIVTVVQDRKSEKELTATPWFLKKSKRIAFLATKADKRRSLAWLFSRWGQPDESPSFLRFMPEVEKRMTAFIDDLALTWPQIIVERETPYGTTNIKIDLPNSYNEKAKKKLPVVLLVHGFLGLNSYDGLLTAIPSRKYIAAAMHYGTIPSDLPPTQYSNHIVKNINAAVNWFGERGHPVYMFDHSMGNVYFMMMDRDFHQLKGIKTYLKGRIGANPFFGEEAKHALLGFLDAVIIPSLSFASNTVEKSMFVTMRRLVPLDSKKGVRKRSISLSDWLISKDSVIREQVWTAVKERIMFLMTGIGSLPHLNRIPIERALNRLPAKVFVLQVHSALEESVAFDKLTGLKNIEKHNIPVLILKSNRDVVARYVGRIYENSPQTQIRDVTRLQEKDLFREHLYHMIEPLKTAGIIEEFIDGVEKREVN